MAPSKVYFTDLRSSFNKNLLAKLNSLLEVLDIKEIIPPRSLVAIKLHFGEKGNVTYIKPENFKGIIEFLEKKDIETSFIETSTLYGGQRYKKGLQGICW